MTYHEEGLTGPYVIEEIYRITKGDALICTDVGQHQMWSAQYYKYTKPRTLLTSGGLGDHGLRTGSRHGSQVRTAGEDGDQCGGETAASA